MCLQKCFYIYKNIICSPAESIYFAFTFNSNKWVVSAARNKKGKEVAIQDSIEVTPELEL